MSMEVRSIAADHAGLAKLCEIAIADADFAEQFVIVLAELWRAGSDRAGRSLHSRHDVMHRNLAHLRIRIIRYQLALDHMWIGHDLRRVVDRTDSDFGGLEEADVFRLRPRADEFTDDGVEFVG